MKRSWVPSVVSAVSFAIVCGLHPSAYAFSQSGRFSVPSEQGGGGGRWFTGSVKDGYTCVVCHRDGKPPSVTLVGLPPFQGYTANQSYGFDIKWPTNQVVGAAALEFTDENGRGAGTITLPGDADLQEDERCTTGEMAKAQAARVFPITDARQIVYVQSCGSSHLRFTWNSAEPGRGPVHFSALFVSGDGSQDPTRDGVTHLKYDFQVAGLPETIRVSQGTCAVSAVARGATSSAHGFSVVCVIPASLLLARRRVRRERRRS